MERIPVVSSNVHEIGYDPAESVLEVVFKRNRFGSRDVYRYKPVTQEEFDALRADGASVGRLLSVLKVQPSIVAWKCGEEPIEDAVPS